MNTIEQTNLWFYDTTKNKWVHIRTCELSNADTWLQSYTTLASQRDNKHYPQNTKFKLSQHRPKCSGKL